MLLLNHHLDKVGYTARMHAKLLEMQEDLNNRAAANRNLYEKPHGKDDDSRGDIWDKHLIFVNG